MNVYLHFCDLFCLQPFCLLFTFHQPACHTCFAFLVHPRWKVKWPNLNQNENYLCQHSPLPNGRIPNSIFSHSAPLHRSNSPLKSYKAWFMFAYLAIWKVSSTSQFGKPPALLIALDFPTPVWVKIITWIRQDSQVSHKGQTFENHVFLNQDCWKQLKTHLPATCIEHFLEFF